TAQDRGSRTATLAERVIAPAEEAEKVIAPAEEKVKATLDLGHLGAAASGAGKLGTTSASPSITLAPSPAIRAAIHASIAAIAPSICSSVMALTHEMKAVVLARISSRSNSAKPPSTVTRARHHQVGSVCLLLVELVRRYEHRVPAQPKSRPTKDAAS